MIKTNLSLRRFDKEMKILEQREQLSKSWLKHFIDLLYILNSKTGLTVNDISSTPRALVWSSSSALGHLRVGSAPGGILVAITRSASDWNYSTPQVGENIGIVVGTGAGAVTPAQDALGTKIDHGIGAGQLLHGGCEIFGLSFVNPNGQFSIVRLFRNLSGGSITVNEVGIYAVGDIAVSSCYVFCIARDLTGGIAVAHTELLEVTYVPQITV